MSELRFDPLERIWVIVAGERGRRPSDFLPTRPERVDRTKHPCPFCLIIAHQGARQAGPRPITERRVGTDPNTHDRVLVVPNRFPALAIESAGERTAVGPYDRIDGVGAHEVVVETTRCETPLRTLSPAQIAAVIGIWRDRSADLVRDRRIVHVSVFRNEGPRAGATLAHAHSQVVGSPVRPARAIRTTESARAHFTAKERCLVCDILRFERDARARLVDAEPGFVAWCPYASRHPFEVWIAPTRHQADFTALADHELAPLATLVKRVLGRVHLALAGADTNIMVQQAPSQHAYTATRDPLMADAYHWHLEIVPRIQPYGGFELGSEMIINPTPPEEAAAHLRSLPE